MTTPLYYQILIWAKGSKVAWLSRLISTHKKAENKTVYPAIKCNFDKMLNHCTPINYATSLHLFWLHLFITVDTISSQIIVTLILRILYHEILQLQNCEEGSMDSNLYSLLIRVFRWRPSLNIMVPCY